MRRTAFAVIQSFLLVFALHALAGPIPDTGQTKCYSDAGEITCPEAGEPFHGQDAHYTINPPSYTKLDAQGNGLPDSATEWLMVRDNVTGLIWEVKTDDGSVHDRDNTYTWCDSNPDTNGGNAGTCGEGTDTEDFINSLNAEEYGGFSDWRLPSKEELQSIIDYGRTSPAVNTEYFPNTDFSNHHWPSTTAHGNPLFAWRVGFRSGYDGGDQKSSSYSVRAVRGGEPRSVDHLTVNGDGTVTDTATGLMWQQATPADNMSWPEALSHCENMRLGLYGDWRLPSIVELASIVDLGRVAPAIDAGYFPDTIQSFYWSASTDMDPTGNAWLVNMHAGYSGRFVKSETYYVRAVRGGQNWYDGHLYITSPAQASTWRIDEIVPITWETQAITGSVRISSSRDGGKTYDAIVESTENDGSYEWTVSGVASVNCVLKIEPLDDASRGTSQGLFTITNHPDTPSSPSPIHRASHVSLHSGLSWSGTDPDAGDTLTYDIYLGTSSTPPLVASDLDSAAYGPGTLTSNTIYYWKIVSRDNHGAETEGPVWSFDTGYNAAGDLDSDGMMDGWEANMGLNPDANDAAADPDGDRFTNGREYQDNTDPRDSESHLVLPDVNGRIPDTGQTKCYSNSEEIACPEEGEEFYGQDAHYTINPPSYIKMDAQGNYLPDNAVAWTMVRDNVTGLIWEVKTDDGSIHDRDNTYTWCDSDPDTNGGNAGTCGDGTNTDDLVAALNADGFGGFADWRLPTREELRSLVHHGRHSPAIDEGYFANTAAGYYWSGSASALNAEYAWSVDFRDGYHPHKNKSDSYHVRGVRGLQPLPTKGFVTNGDGTVTDTTTGLMWQRGTPEEMDWQSALLYCAGMALGSHSDWRLPGIKELASLADLDGYGPAIDTDYFPDSVESSHWSSTTRDSSTNGVWLVEFSIGRGYHLYKSDSVHPQIANFCVARGDWAQPGSLS